MSRVTTARADPEAVRAYWNMSRGDSERAFRAARRHSRFVRFLRIALPAAVVFITIGMSLVTWLNPLRLLTALPVNIDDLVVSGTKITMEQPRVNGFTNDKRAYEFTAEAAAQDLTKPDIVELRNINAKIEMEDKSTMNMKADTGVYDTKRESLKLDGNILLRSTSGNTGKLTEATIDVRKGNVVSDRPVELEMLQGILNANKLEVVDSGTLVRFHGGVSMVLMLNGTAVPKEKIGQR
ncbi:MAG: LPS export ABC transporter periplasmic protein LptC [Pseudolabrys sp.]|nr:LPS export ABC transporter periplasmic protein LptC [Pseudolabrys sp.]MDP2297472.1 LPS export ABC transporter periplasmic protein LptC [Pseudolabrys sp.]